MKAVLISLGLVLLIGSGLFFFRDRLEDRFSGTGDFPAADYRDAPLNYVGNTYRLSGSVEAVLDYRDGVGRIVQISEAVSRVQLPVFLPDSIKTNLAFGQRFSFLVRIRDGGLIFADEMEKL